MNIPIQKDKIAIVIVGYNRLSSTKRLVESLIAAKYPNNDVPLIFSIDASGNKELYDWVELFEWPYGEKYVNIQKERLGLRKHIYVCGDLTRYFKGVIILEDDIIVSPDFYNFTTHAVEYYYDDNNIAGIALFADQTNGYAYGLPNFRYNDGSDAYLLQEVCTSGECFTDRMWNGFRKWLVEHENPDPEPYYMPSNIKVWRQAWSKFYNMYLIDTNRYFLTPYLSRTTNCGDAGVHSDVDLNFLHASMLWENKAQHTFKPFELTIKYDMFGDYIGLGKSLGIPEEVICVDFYGNKPLKSEHKYLVSLYHLPYKVIRSFGLNLEPIEMNLIRDIHGSDIFLYDISEPAKCHVYKKLSLHQLSYFMRGTSYRIQLRFSCLTIRTLLKKKIQRLLKIK